MITKKFVYEDFLGVQREEEHYFHMSDKELTMFITTEGGYTLDKVMERLVRDHNVRNLLKIIEQLIDASYGIISPDGRRFEKTPEILADFKQTEAYSQLFMELTGDENAAVNFIRGLVTKSTLKKMDEQLKSNQAIVEKYPGMEVTTIGSK